MLSDIVSISYHSLTKFVPIYVIMMFNVFLCHFNLPHWSLDMATPAAGITGGAAATASRSHLLAWLRATQG
uniref:Uncharacterized protein n=1 Tax=Oryza brachyantha TaxID=4533 RepID=J3MJL7_ORYBR